MRYTSDIIWDSVTVEAPDGEYIQECLDDVLHGVGRITRIVAIIGRLNPSGQHARHPVDVRSTLESLLETIREELAAIDPKLADLPLSEAIAMKGYAGSVAFDGAGDRVAITSPRGGRVQIFGNDGSHLETIRRSDVCGAAPSAAGFLFSDGMGGLLELGEQLRPLHSRPGRAWDNHIVSLRNATT